MEDEHQILLKKWKAESASFRTQTRCLHEIPEVEDIHPIWESYSLSSILANTEVVLSNMPLTIGAVGLSWITMGVVWFKFMEEMNVQDNVCVPTPFRSQSCTYPEFPGCFECDTNNRTYQIAVRFHYLCHIVGFVCCLLLLVKAILAWQVVSDELSNPTTAAPVGVVCIAMVCVAAGRGLLGEMVVIATSCFQVCLAFWFLYFAFVKFRLLPDPGWFPCTVGISYAATKTWLYFPNAGIFLMILATIFFFSTYFISLYRVFVNLKIAAPVCSLQLSGPSITMYAMTIMAQPSTTTSAEEIQWSLESRTQFQKLHRQFYLPMQHFMMILSLIGMASVLHSLWVRWSGFRRRPFSPAHMAFVISILSHANAVQAYRSSVNSFSTIRPGSPFKIALFSYWLVCLIAGTLVNLIFSYKYVLRLQEWTGLEIGDEEEPVEPSETMLHEIMTESGLHESLQSQLVNPAVLQANEAGALVRVRRGSRDLRNHNGIPFVRTRRISSLGFDLILSESELRQERAELLSWVATQAPRTRKRRTYSIPIQWRLLGSTRGYDSYYGSTAFAETGTMGQERINRRATTLT